MDACYGNRFQKKLDSLLIATPYQLEGIFFQLEADVIQDYQKACGYEALSAADKNAAFMKMKGDLLNITLRFKSIAGKIVECVQAVANGGEKRSLVDNVVKQLFAEIKLWPNFKGKDSLLDETTHKLRNLRVTKESSASAKSENIEKVVISTMEGKAVKTLGKTAEKEKEAQTACLQRPADITSQSAASETRKEDSSRQHKPALKSPKSPKKSPMDSESLSKRRVSFVEVPTIVAASSSPDSSNASSVSNAGAPFTDSFSSGQPSSSKDWESPPAHGTSSAYGGVYNADPFQQTPSVNLDLVSLPGNLVGYGTRTSRAIIEAVTTVTSPAPEHIGDLPENICVNELNFTETADLGEGSFAIVQTARFRNSLVAVKRNYIPYHCSIYNERKQVAERELRAAKELHHDHLLPAYAYCWETVGRDRCLYLVLEHCKHGDLSKLIRPGFNSPMETVYTFRHIVDWVHQLMSVLAYLHENGYWHRDLKPENILVFDGDNSPRAILKVCDMGMNKSESTATKTAFRGTYRYAAPETLHNTYTGASDIYAVGLILWELITRRKVYENCENDVQLIYATKETPVEPEVHQELQHFLYSCLEPAPTERVTPQQAIEALAELRQHPSYAFDDKVYNTQYDTPLVPHSPLHIRDERMESAWDRKVKNKMLEVKFIDPQRLRASAKIDKRNAEHMKVYRESIDLMRKYHAEYDQKYLTANYLRRWGNNYKKFVHFMNDACEQQSGYIQPFREAFKQAKFKKVAKVAEWAESVYKLIGNSQSGLLAALTPEDHANIDVYEKAIKDLIATTFEGTFNYGDELMKMSNLDPVKDFLGDRGREFKELVEKIIKDLLSSNDERIVREGYQQLYNAAISLKRNLREHFNFLEHWDYDDESTEDEGEGRDVRETLGEAFRQVFPSVEDDDTEEDEEEEEEEEDDE